jgi:hypothetical protein
LVYSINVNLFPVQLSPEGVPDLIPGPMPVSPPVAGTAVGRFNVRTATPTPAPIPRQLSFQDELLEKCRERGLTPDRPALFGVRPVTNPSVSPENFLYLIVQSDPHLSSLPGSNYLLKLFRMLRTLPQRRSPFSLVRIRVMRIRILCGRI